MAKKEAEVVVEAPPTSVFVTGSSTGAGLAVIRKLVAKGYRVTGATTEGTIGANKIRQAGGIPVYPDLLRESSIRSVLLMASVDIIVHMEAQGLNGIPQHKIDWQEDIKMLRDSGDALVAAGGKTEVKRIIYPSFAFLYGDTGGEWVDEEAHLDNGNEFFDAAIEAEEAVLDGGIPGYVLRTGFVYGGDVQAMRALHDDLIAGKAVLNGTGYASWIHIEDLADAVVALVERDENDEAIANVLNIVDDSPATPNEFIDKFAASLGLGAANKTSGGPFVDVFGDPTQLALLSQSAKVKNDKAKEQLGWQPRYTDQAAGIDQALMIWRAEEAPEETPAEEIENEVTRAYALLTARAQEEQEERA